MQALETVEQNAVLEAVKCRFATSNIAATARNAHRCSWILQPVMAARSEPM